MKHSTHSYVQFPSNHAHKVLWHVLQQSTQSNPWFTIHIMNIIEKKERKQDNKKKEREKNKKTKRSMNRSRSIGFEYEHELVFFSQGC